MIRTIKFLLRCVLRLLYGVEVHGMEHYHEAGDRVLIVANHSSLLDGVLLYAWLPETPTFAINTQIASRRMFRPFLRFVDLFIMDPISPLSVKSLIRFLRRDRKAVIFPEGRITVTGILMKIYEGPGLVADRAEAAVLPISIDGAQHSTLSYMEGRLNIRWFPRIRMHVMAPERIRIDASVQGHRRRALAGREMSRIMYELFFRTCDFRRTIFEALVDASRRHGRDRVVLEDMNREPISYAQIITRTMVLAGLIKTESGPGPHVGVMLPNVTGAVITFMALQYLGRVPAMLNYTAGAQAILKACDSAGIDTIFTSRQFVEKANLEPVVEEIAGSRRVVFLEDLRTRLTPARKLGGWLRSRAPLRSYRGTTAAPGPDAPAVILFTSGSEGVPKGVVLSHANLLSNFAQSRCHLDFRTTDTLFCCLPLFHSFGLNGGMLMPLLSGSRVLLYPTPLHYRLIPELIYETGSTILFGADTYLRGYARYANSFDFTSLRYVIAGAERLRDDTQKLWMDRFGIRILQGYGVTEASPVISVNTPIAGRLGSVGRLLPGMQYYLDPVPGLDRGGRLVVSGPNVMLGYLLSDSGGVIQPPSTDRGPGWYDTGDIADLDADGFITILGRARRFAKIGGEMVSLAAVEELAQAAWPDHAHAALSLPDPKKGEKIVLVTENAEATRREIQETARGLGYAELYLPRKVVLTDELPLLSTGKIDYIALSELAMVEDREGSGWIRRITRFVKGEYRAGSGDRGKAPGGGSGAG